jgi:hypothetical protein
MITYWQGLGAFVYTGKNLGIKHLDKLKSCGSQRPWICLVIYNDEVAGDSNRFLLPGIKAWCKVRGISVFGWYNGTGGDPYEDARAIAGLHTNLALDGIILDLEAAYHYPEGDANKMPYMLSALRKQLPTVEIGVSTNSMNSSMIYNGRVLTPKQSFYDLRVRCLPQWYSSYYAKNDSERPQAQMQWLKANGSSDFNFRDDNAKTTSFRGLPLSYVHGTLEVTGLENSDLAQEISDCVAAKVYGLTPGISIYTLENTPDSDFDVLARHKGEMFL